MDERLYITILFDFYGDLLTERQKEFFDMYYLNDLSLSEIGEPAGVTRQAVSDMLKRTNGHLMKYEAKLGFAAWHAKMMECADKLDAQLQAVREEIPVKAWKKIEKNLATFREL